MGRRKARRLLVLHGAKGLDAIRAAAGQIPVEERSRAELDRMAGGARHQGVILETAQLPVFSLRTWLERPIASDAVLVLLDGIEDPHNFGAIIRSAAALGAVAVVFGKDRAAPLSPVVAKAAAGALERIDLIRVTNVTRAIQSLQQAGFWVAALDPEGDQLLWDADLTGRVALVIGGEGQGIRRLVGEHCDLHLRIPLTGPISSLNASVSAAVALTECARQRQSRIAPRAT